MISPSHMTSYQTTGGREVAGSRRCQVGREVAGVGRKGTVPSEPKQSSSPTLTGWAKSSSITTRDVDAGGHRASRFDPSPLPPRSRPAATRNRPDPNDARARPRTRRTPGRWGHVLGAGGPEPAGATTAASQPIEARVRPEPSPAAGGSARPPGCDPTARPVGSRSVDQFGALFNPIRFGGSPGHSVDPPLPVHHSHDDVHQLGLVGLGSRPPRRRSAGRNRRSSSPGGRPPHPRPRLGRPRSPGSRSMCSVIESVSATPAPARRRRTGSELGFGQRRPVVSASTTPATARMSGSAPGGPWAAAKASQ